MLQTYSHDGPKEMEEFRDDYVYGDSIYEDEEAMEEFLEPALTQDVYSLLYTADAKSLSFFFAFMSKYHT